MLFCPSLPVLSPLSSKIANATTNEVCYRSLWITAAAKWLAVKPVQSDEWCVLKERSGLNSSGETSDRVNKREGVIEGQQWAHRGQDRRIRCVWRGQTHTRGPPGRDGITTTSTISPFNTTTAGGSEDTRSWICGFSTQRLQPVHQKTGNKTKLKLKKINPLTHSDAVRETPGAHQETHAHHLRIRMRRAAKTA